MQSVEHYGLETTRTHRCPNSRAILVQSLEQRAFAVPDTPYVPTTQVLPLPSRSGVRGSIGVAPNTQSSTNPETRSLIISQDQPRPGEKMTFQPQIVETKKLENASQKLSKGESEKSNSIGSKTHQTMVWEWLQSNSERSNKILNSISKDLKSNLFDSFRTRTNSRLFEKRTLD